MKYDFEIIFTYLLFLILLNGCITEKSPNRNSIFALINNPAPIFQTPDIQKWSGCMTSVLKNDQILGYFCVQENFQNCSKETFLDIPTENFKNSIITNLDIHDLGNPTCLTAIDSIRDRILQTSPADSFQIKNKFSDFNLVPGTISFWKDCSSIRNQTKEYKNIMNGNDRSFAMNWKMLLAIHGNPNESCLNSLSLTPTEILFFQNVITEKLKYGIQY